jgi:hypothetical protein
MSPLPLIAHLLAAAVGTWGAFAAGAAIAPDLPSGEPGVVEAEEAQISGPSDPDSLFHPGPFSTAISQIEDQLGSEEEIARMTVRAGEIDVDVTEDGDGVAIEDVSTSAPYLLAYAIGEARKSRLGRADVDGPDDLVAVELRPGPEGPTWTALIAPRFAPPRAYRAVVLPGQVAFQIDARPVGGP